jgi:hypothetical protein
MVEFDAVVRGSSKASIKVGKINSVKLLDFVGKRVRVIVEEVQEGVEK